MNCSPPSLISSRFKTNRINCRHRAILSYLSTSNLQASYNTLRDELGQLDTSYSLHKLPNGDDDQRYKGLLEKKWTSVIRLQKKVEYPIHDSRLASCSVLLTACRSWI